MAEPIGWFTVNGVHVPIFDGQSKADAYKKYIDSKHGKDVARLSSKSNTKSINKKEKTKKDLEKQLDEGLNDLDFDELNSVYKNTKDPEIREKLMNKMQEKDPYKFGKEIMGLDMKEIDYKGSFDSAIRHVDKMNSNKEYTTETLYHGTNANFDKFSYSNFGKTDEGDFGQGIYLTTNKSTANKYGKNIKEVEVKYKNPLILNNNKDFEKFYKKYGDEFGEAKQIYNSKQVAVSIMKMGYDAVIDNVYGQTIIYNLDNIKIKK